MGHAYYRNNVVPVFDPSFPGFCQTFMSKILPQEYPGLDTRSDPYLVSYMTDAELPWSTSTLDNFLTLPSADPNRTAAQQWLAARGHSTPTAQDRTDFQTYVADTYFRITAGAVRGYDPHHMVGYRFLGGDPSSPYLFKAARKYLDLVTVNYYSSMDPGKAIEPAAAAADIPYISSDMYVKSVDSGMPNTTGYGYTVKTQADRGAYYQQMIMSVLSSAHGVGAGWLQLADNDMSDPNPEPSNADSNKGLMTVHYPINYGDNPYTAMTDRIRDMNRNLYSIAYYLRGTPSTPTPTPTTTVIKATATAYVQNGSFANTNFSSSSQLLVKQAVAPYDHMSYITFNLAGLTKVSSANLVLFGGLMNGSDPSFTIRILAVNGSFNQNTITFNNAPTTGTTISSAVIRTQTQQPYTLDLTSYIQQLVAAHATQATLAIVGTANTTEFAAFNSDLASANQPELVVLS